MSFHYLGNIKNVSKKNNINEIKISDSHQELLRYGYSKHSLCWIDVKNWKIINPLGSNQAWKVHWGFLDKRLKQIRDLLKSKDVDFIHETADLIKIKKGDVKLDEISNYELYALLALLNLNNILNDSFRRTIAYIKWAKYISSQPDVVSEKMMFNLVPLVTSHGAKGMSILSSHLEKALAAKKNKEKKRSSAIKGHEFHRNLKEMAIERYKNSEYKSMLDAARKITPEIEDIAKNSGKPLASTNAQRTVYGWIRSSKI